MVILLELLLVKFEVPISSILLLKILVLLDITQSFNNLVPTTLLLLLILLLILLMVLLNNLSLAESLFLLLKMEVLLLVSLMFELEMFLDSVRGPLTLDLLLINMVSIFLLSISSYLVMVILLISLDLIFERLLLSLLLLTKLGNFMIKTILLPSLVALSSISG